MRTHSSREKMVNWIFLSPHLDDAAFSCGGAIAELTARGDTAGVWTIFAADPTLGPQSPLAVTLHERWGTSENAMEVRRNEDLRSCSLLGAGVRHFPFQDCIYRRNPITGEPLIRENSELFQPPLAIETPLVESISHELAELMPAGAQVVCPLTLGGHIDHRLVRRAAETLNLPLLYYADYPYAVQSRVDRLKWIQGGWKTVKIPVSQASLEKWQAAAAEHLSQINTFWGSRAEMESAIRGYWQAGGGSRLWGNVIQGINNKSAN